MSDRALLVLEDGTLFEGISHGAAGTTTGEVCFNTSMAGYQEVLTDPSYHGQIVTMTAPQIGNTGVNDADDQSRKPWVSGFVVRDASRSYSSWRAEGSLDDYLERHGVVGISGIDTRRLTRHLRDRGAMRGAISSEIADPSELVDVARSSPEMIGRDLAIEVSTAEPYQWTAEDLAVRSVSGFAAGAEFAPATASLMSGSEERRRICALDLGLKRNILDLLCAAGFDVTVLPATASHADVMSGGYEGVFLSNGPGDPEPVDYAISTVGALIGELPIFGICLGHQILALAAGCETYKLKFGHRGGNHPVKRAGSDRIEITCQNHGFAVKEESIERTPAVLTHVNLNDGTVEGIEIPGAAFSVQYHPESGPGPHDSRYLFEAFGRLIDEFEPSDVLAGRKPDPERV